MTNKQVSTSASAPVKVAIIGAGFSGLTLARALLKHKIAVDIYEAEVKIGGMLQTNRVPILLESAANAIISDAHVEDLFNDLNIKIFKSGYKSKKRWILRQQKPQQWPLTIKESWRALKSFLSQYWNKTHYVQPGESVQDWALRVFSEPAVIDYLLNPALQGVYAVNTQQLSAELVVEPLFKKVFQAPQGQYKGSIAPAGGMQNLMESLSRQVLRQGGALYLNHPLRRIEDLPRKYHAVVIATHIHTAGDLLAQAAPKLATQLWQIPTQGLSSVGMGFFEKRKQKGFGCLFPRSENISALGTLFNSDIFQNRGPLESETWIFKETDLNESELVERALQDRQKVFRSKAKPEFTQVRRWPKGIPIYSAELLAWLKSQSSTQQAFTAFKSGFRVQETTKSIYLTGNYLGGLGLAKILSYNIRLADRIQKETYETPYS